MYIHTPAPFISPPQICHNRNHISHITLRPKGLMLNSALPTGNVIINLILYLCLNLCSSKTLPWPISLTTARKPQANASPTKSIPTNPSSPPSKPPATPAPPPYYLCPQKSLRHKHLTISLIQRLPQKIFNFRVTFSLFLQLIIIEGNNKGTPTGSQP